MLIVGAVPAAQSTLLGHVIVLAEESCVTFKANVLAYPLAAGLLNVYVTFSLSVCVKTVPSRKLIVAALELELTAVLSSCIPLSNLTTPLASAVTALEASVVHKVVMTK